MASIPTSALAVGVTVIVGLVPPPAVMGAVHTLISVPSDALKCSASVNVSPAESVTLPAVGPPLAQTPTRTTSRFPVVRAAHGVTERLVTPPAVGGDLLHEGGRGGLGAGRDGVGRRRRWPSPDGVGRGHRERVAGAVRQPGHASPTSPNR